MALLLMIGLISCDASKKAGATDSSGSNIKETERARPEKEPMKEELEERTLDTMVITAPRPNQITPEKEESYALPVYNGSHLRENDLVHTALNLRFDWEEESVLGEATLTLEPFFYPVEQVTLDAKDFEIHEIRLEPGKKSLQYDYDQQQLVIQLDRTYEQGESYTLFIDYTAHPSATGGSAAISSDQGLFFIKPDADSPDKPRQIWTQGETEWNSRWFPTIDKPNERCTQETYLTVEDQFETLSNGVLVSSQKNPDGTRTDYWKMEQPHAPYLFMIAVGDYAIVKDKWGDIPVSYYVEHEFEEDARAIFPYTVEMLEFFSDQLNLKYPWPKYDQIVVRDYVSGAMENTTAVIYGEFMQRDRRALIDELFNEKIVAHELLHHWFGDLVTCESWANLTMNEGFANYSEYLWLEHKHGKDEADFHLIDQWNGYFGEARGNVHPLIYYGYNDKEDMFDSHSYNKGGSVLHMLRNYVGDAAFWAALNKYLTDHAYNSVEVHDLRLAFEAVTGQDLNWFFNQWYLNQGHPVLDITYGYDEATGKASVTVEQTQDPERMLSVFVLPAAVEIFTEEGQPPIREMVRVNQREQTFRFDVPREPKLISFDADHVLLAVKNENKSKEQLLFQYYHSSSVIGRLESFQGLQNESGPEVEAMMEAALQDNFWLIRGVALANTDATEPEVLETIRRMAAADPHSRIRADALATLMEAGDSSSVDIAINAIETDSAYNVISAGLDLLLEFDRPTALRYAQKLEDTESSSILGTISFLYAESGDREYLSFFQKKMDFVDSYDAISFFTSYGELVGQFSPEEAMAAIVPLEKITLDLSQSPWRRLAAMKALNDLRNSYRSRANELETTEAKEELEKIVDHITKIMEKVKGMETDNNLKNMYNSMELMERS